MTNWLKFTGRSLLLKAHIDDDETTSNGILFSEDNYAIMLTLLIDI